MNRIAEAADRTDRMLVDQNRRRVWRVAITDMLLFLAALLSWVTWPTWHNTWAGVVPALLIGAQFARPMVMGLRRAAAYRGGWIRGRAAMVHSMSEALRRGMTAEEWLLGEMQRDMATLGIDPLQPE